MTASTQRLRALSDAGPVSKSYRRFLGKASITLLAVTILSVYLLPLLYMVTTSFQQPGQASTPGAPIYPAKPLTGTHQGDEYPLYTVTIDGVERDLMLVVKGREQSTFVDPNDPTATPIEWVDAGGRSSSRGRSRRRSRTTRSRGRS